MKEIEKELYSFEVKTTRLVEKKEEKQENGKIFTVTESVEEEVPVRIVLKKPTRKLIDEAEMVSAVKMAECVKKGILTKAMLTKKYADTGGVLTEKEAKEHANRYTTLSDLQLEWVRLTLVKEPSEKQIERLTEINKKMNELRRQIANVESAYSALYDNTADVIAMKAEVLFYTLMLTCIKENLEDGSDKLVPFFRGNSYEDKLEDYYAKEDSPDDIYMSIRSKIGYFISFWKNGVISTKEEFAKLEDDLDNGRV